MEEMNTWPGWESVDTIGKGSFGKVYKIQKKELGKVYTAALKVITISTLDYTIPSFNMPVEQSHAYFQNLVEDIARECALMYEFKGYTNFVSYEDHKVIEDRENEICTILIRMELLTPVNRWLLTEGSVPKKIAKIGLDICTALEILHNRGIIHRDIKPENIFVNKTGDFKLGDFGIARALSQANTMMSIKGTPTYMAPEVFRGEHYGITSDIYSLGVVLYRLLSGAPPFIQQSGYSHSGSEEAFRRRMNGEPIPPLTEGSENLRKVIMRAIAFEPGDRFQSATEFKRALLKCPEFSQEKGTRSWDSPEDERNDKSLKSIKDIFQLFFAVHLRQRFIVGIILCTFLIFLIIQRIVFPSIHEYGEDFKATGNVVQNEEVQESALLHSVEGQGEEQNSVDLNLVLRSDLLLSGTRTALQVIENGKLLPDQSDVIVESSNTNVAYVEYDPILQEHVLYMLYPGSTQIQAEYQGQSCSSTVYVLEAPDDSYGISLTPVYNSVILHGAYSSKASKLRFLLKGCKPEDVTVSYYFDPELVLTCKGRWDENEFIIEVLNNGSKTGGEMNVLVTDKNRKNVIYSDCRIAIVID